MCYDQGSSELADGVFKCQKVTCLIPEIHPKTAEASHSQTGSQS